MTLQAYVIDTNVIVSGLLGADGASPPARILDAMLDGDLVYLMSEELLTDYASVLRRPNLARLHRLDGEELDRLLADLVANAMWREPAIAANAPDPGDNHLWALLECHPEARLVTGDRLLLEHPPNVGAAMSPRRCIESLAG